MERRSFIKSCTLLCAGGGLLSAVLQSCGAVYYASSSIEMNKLKINKKEFIDAKNVERKFIVIRNDKLQFPVCVYKFNTDYVALSMECTHQSCELQPNKISLVCPCHGGEFSNKGVAINPPVDKDLKQYKVSTDYENIYIEL